MDDLLIYLAFYERRTAEVYEKIIPSIENGMARLLLKILAIDSRKHSEIFRMLSGKDIPELPPEAEVGEVAAESIRILKAAEAQIGTKKPVEILESLVRYEKLMNEEYLVEIYVKALDLNAKNGLVKKILRSIADDEDRHKDFLEEAIRLEREAV